MIAEIKYINLNKYKFLHPCIIFEIANTHGGNFKELVKIVNKFNSINYKKKIIKFQIFHPDKISTKDYSWHRVYKKLFFSHSDWSKIFRLIQPKAKIFLDIFDDYGIEVFRKNFSVISGIKLQSSIINNLNIFNKLKELTTEKKIIINVSGYNINSANIILERFSRLNFKETIIQFGFQSYPTKVQDLAINKLLVLKNFFPNCKFSFSDHVDCQDDFSYILPSVLASLRIDYIEKHVCLGRRKAKYDFYSSLDFEQTNKMLILINKTIASLNGSLISMSEKKYLDSTIQKTVLCKNIYKDSLLSLEDLDYKRSNNNNFLDTAQIQNLQKKFYIIRKDKKKDNVLKKKDFKKAKIGIFVIARLKSSRLPLKALLKIQHKESILRCFDNLKYFKNVFLLTSTLKEDSPLVDLVKKKNKSVKIFRGEPDNVIKRIVDCAKKYNIDTITRVTGDCPVISSEILEFLLKKHFENGADFTYASKSAVGTSGEIYSANSLKYIFKKKPKGELSEYLLYYFINNHHLLKINKIDLPKSMVADFRLTLDYQEDLIFFNKLFQKLNNYRLSPNLLNIFKILRKNYSISKINNKIKLIYLKKNFLKKLYIETRINF